MATITRRSLRSRVERTELAAADDLNGGSTTLDVSGAQRVIILQVNDGTAGTAGIDVIQISKDGGSTWTADDTLQAIAQDDVTGDVLADAALNAAGTEPTGCAVFKSGPHSGPTLMRCVRDDAAAQPGTSVDWVTGAPSVDAIVIGA